MFGTGNSLKYSSYKEDINKICNGLALWTRISFHTPFKNLGRVLPIGTQEDGISCGICVLNALENMIFAGHLFTHDRRNALHVKYFTDIVELLLDPVSVKCQAPLGVRTYILIIVHKRTTQGPW